MKKTGRRIAILLAAAMITGCAAQTPATPATPAGQSTSGQETSGQDTSGQEATALDDFGAPSAENNADIVQYDGVTAVLARYPGGDGEEQDAENYVMSDAYAEWWDDYRNKIFASEELQEGMDDYYTAMMREILVTDSTENTVCSPLNIYVALAMLAECTDGNTRAQILDVLEVPDVETLRTRVKVLWEANYVDTPVVQSLLADSVWMREGVTYNEETLQRLAETYYASSFSGAMGTEQMDKALQSWMNDNTGGLLEDAIRDIHTRPETVLALVSTIYFKAAWYDKFYEGLTDKQIFHGAEGDTEVDMMHRSDMMMYSQGDNFGAVEFVLNDSGSMFFFLPEEGQDVRELVTDPQMMQTLRGRLDNTDYVTVNLSVPKFRVEAKTDLMGTMQRLGMSDVMSAGLADFTPLTTDESLEDLALSSAEHAAVVEVDEEGVTGAAYTIMMVAEGAMDMESDEIDFVLDRPFFFAVTAADGSILFTGIVQDI